VTTVILSIVFVYRQLPRTIRIIIIRGWYHMHPRTLPTQIYIRVTRVDERIIRIIIIIGGIADRITTIVVIHSIIVCDYTRASCMYDFCPYRIIILPLKKN
jgi:hypothetical protein